MKVNLCIWIILCCINCKAQDRENVAQLESVEELKYIDYKLEELILSENKIGTKFFFKEYLNEGILEHDIVYIGAIQNEKYGDLKFVFSTTYAGLNEGAIRASSTIAIYNNNIRLGQYYVGGVYDIIPTIGKNELIITYDDENCNETTRLSFRESIPDEIFVNCKEEQGRMFGDLWAFDKDN